MLFTDEFIDSLKDDPIKGALEICQIAYKGFSSPNLCSKSDHERLIEVLALLTELLESKLLIIDKSPQFRLIGDIKIDCKNIIEFVHYLRPLWEHHSATSFPKATWIVFNCWLIKLEI